MLRNWQLILAGIWILIAASIIFREPLGLRQNAFSESQWQLGLATAGMLALWNIVRWYTQSGTVRSTEVPLKPKNEAAPYEYNPDLDFQKMEREQGERGA